LIKWSMGSIGRSFGISLVYVFFTIGIGVLTLFQGVLYAQNNAPGIDNIADQNVDEDIGLQTIGLTGITDGDGSTQIVTITATSSNQALVPNANLNVIYTNPSATGSLEFTAVLDGYGTTTITVTVMDDGGTSPGIDTYQTTFDIVVNPINDPPTFTKGPDIPSSGNMPEDAGTQNVFNWATNINAGGTLNNEAAQTLTFTLTVVGTTSNIAFDNLAINSFGTLTFKSTANTNGTATIDVYLEDDGSNTPPNQNRSITETFTITVDPVNDPPNFTGGGDIVIDEGIGFQTFSAWATAISPGGGSDELSQLLTFNLVPSSVTGTMSFISDPMIDPVSGDLTFEVVPDGNGSATYLLSLMDDGSSVAPNQNTSSTITMKITVNAINDPPSFTMVQTLDTLEDAGFVSIVNFATDLTPGPSDETTQKLSFEVSILQTTGGLTFIDNPRISSIGTLTFESSPDDFGTAQLKVILKDDGLSLPPHNNTSIADTLLININPLNDAPSFLKGTDPIVFEDQGVILLPGWATNISPGADNESAQVLTFILTSTGSLGTIAFTTGPDINANGDLTFEVGPDLNGSEFYEIRLMDDGPSDTKNFNISPIQIAKIEATAVNDAPVFTVGPDLFINENQGLTTDPGWATNITPGGGTDEIDQKLTFNVVPVQFTGNLVFVIGPLIGDTGDISYQTAPNTWGVAEFAVTLADDGSNVVPNVNISANQTFKITVVEVNDPPTGILLSSNTIVETSPIGTEIGTFTGVDPDDATHTFVFVTGVGSGDNGSFLIEGDKLISNQLFDFREKNLYSIRVQASDGLSVVEAPFLIEILVEPVSTVDFPSAFTPNNDGENDTWQIERIEYFPTAAINIYTSTGQRVFTSVGYVTAWDGTWNGNILPEDTYHVVIDLKNETPVIQSTITILR